MLNIEELAFLASASFIIGFSGAIVPGPMFVATVVWSTRKGHIAGPLVVLGHVIAETVVMLVLLLGLNFIFESNEIRLLSGFLGGVFLVWSSINLFKSSISSKDQLLPDLGGNSSITRNPTSAGLITSISNPYFFIWWATIGNHYTTLGLEIASYIGVMVFAFAHWLSDLTWFSLVSISASKGRKVMGDRVYRFVLGLCGILLMTLGIMFIVGSTNVLFSTV
jgi:threonine/homoserine/homoserine lactone efflux protein